MSRFRKIAKNIKNQPKLKKMLAKWLTEQFLTRGFYNAEEMLLKGHRGFLAMSEKELTNQFDKLYSDIEKEIEEESKQNHWTTERELEAKTIALQSADVIYNEIFEQVFL